MTSKLKIIFGLGIWIALLPYLGLPRSWKDALFTLSGFLVVLFCYLIRQEEASLKHPEISHMEGVSPEPLTQ